MSLSVCLSSFLQKEQLRRPARFLLSLLAVRYCLNLATAPTTSLLLSSDLVVLDDVVYDAVLYSLVRPHYVVTVGVALDPLVGLTRVLSEDLVEAPLGHDELFGVDLHVRGRSEEHTSELQLRQYLVCRLLLEKKKNPISVYRLYL